MSRSDTQANTPDIKTNHIQRKVFRCCREGSNWWHYSQCRRQIKLPKLPENVPKDRDRQRSKVLRVPLSTSSRGWPVGLQDGVSPKHAHTSTSSSPQYWIPNTNRAASFHQLPKQKHCSCTLSLQLSHIFTHAAHWDCLRKLKVGEKSVQVIPVLQLISLMAKRQLTTKEW